MQRRVCGGGGSGEDEAWGGGGSRAPVCMSAGMCRAASVGKGMGSSQMQDGTASGPGVTLRSLPGETETDSHAFAPLGAGQRYLQQPGRKVASRLLVGERVQKRGPYTVNLTRP